VTRPTPAPPARPATDTPPRVGPSLVTDPDPAPRAWWRGPVAWALALGVLVRAVHVLAAGFPLNDGGMFYVMMRDLQQAGFRLPAQTTYNALGIPFAYSPLAFYVGAALDSATPLDLVGVLRVLPFVTSLLTLGAFALLARRLLPERWVAPAVLAFALVPRGFLWPLMGGGLTRGFGLLFALLARRVLPERWVAPAVLAFALVPRGFLWPLMGGGLTRGFGLLFALLALWQVHAAYTGRRWRPALWAALCAGLTVLSHLGTAPWLAASIVLFWAVYGRHRHGVLASIVVALGATLVAAPWGMAIVGMHGWAPFLAAGGAGESVVSDGGTRWRVLVLLAALGVRDTGEALFPLIGVLAVLGALLSVVSRRLLLLPVWWALTFLVDPRQGATFATVPVSLLAGIGARDALWPLLARAARGAEAAGDRMARRLPRAVAAALVLYATLCALATDPRYSGEARQLVALSPADRAAMREAGARTPADARFLVISRLPWFSDRYAEWFPVLSGRRSVATVQGYEWRPNGEFAAQQKRAARLAACGAAAADCLDEWAGRTGEPFTHVYVPTRPNDCCGSLVRSLGADPRYTRLYAGPTAVIFARGRE